MNKKLIKVILCAENVIKLIHLLSKLKPQFQWCLSFRGADSKALPKPTISYLKKKVTELH